MDEIVTLSKGSIASLKDTLAKLRKTTAGVGRDRRPALPGMYRAQIVSALVFDDNANRYKYKFHEVALDTDGLTYVEVDGGRTSTTGEGEEEDEYGNFAINIIEANNANEPESGFRMGNSVDLVDTDTSLLPARGDPIVWMWDEPYIDGSGVIQFRPTFQYENSVECGGA